MQDPHGGNIFAHKVKLDFSANMNPLGMPESVRRAVTDSAGLWEHYPDPDCTALTAALSEREGIPADRIVCGNGADDLLFRMASAFSPKTALIAAPCFGEYRRALMAAGCAVCTYALNEADNFALTDAILPAIGSELDMVLLCTPNNPTGQLIAPVRLSEITEKCRNLGVRLVLDACFLELTAAYQMPLPEDALVLKAFTKSHAMPGLRLGYVLCPDAQTAKRIKEQGQFWSVSAPAQAAGAAAVREDAYLARARTLIAGERRFLTEQLGMLGLKVYPSDANFLLFRSEPELDERMLREGILIRSCGNYMGLDGRYFRIAVRKREEHLQLLAALRRCI